MYRILAIALVLCVAAPAATTQEPVPIGKGIDIGPLADCFTRLSGDGEKHFKQDPSVRQFQLMSDGYLVTLSLRATKDVDTADLLCRVGFFDKSKHLMQASPLQFEAAFPLLKGESVNATCWFKHEHIENGLPWHMIYIRPGKTTK
jgi:hypothetical protein